MKNNNGNAFDTKLFKRLLKYATPYNKTFYFVVFAAIMLSVLAVLRPYLLRLTIDRGIIESDSESLIFYVSSMLVVLIFEVLFQFSFIFFANWLGQEVIRDIRVKLFKHMMNFKKQYFDNSSVGRLVTRAVSDIETIASIFSQGLFMIISDLLKMIVVLGFMFWQSWQLTLLVVTVLPFIIYATRVFQKKMKVAFGG